ncbi:dynein heavy chain, partial [Kipferlia bialata]
AILFFVMSSLCNVNAMYEYSLSSFLAVFRKSLDQAAPDPIVEKRLYNIVNKVTENLYDYVCTSLFERHKLMFSFQMACRILASDDSVSLPLLDFFLKGNQSLEKPTQANPHPTWLSEQGWADLI